MAKTTAMDPRIERAILLITNRFREPLTLPDIAAGAGLSPFHLHRVFKAETGQTPATYLQRVRLEHAAHLMIVLPDASLLHIAIDSGFTSAATFARAFRSRHGTSATEYRHRKRLDPQTPVVPVALSLHRLPTRRLRVERCALDENALDAGYERLRRRARKLPGAIDARVALGIFVDAPFHTDRAQCRHYLALDGDEYEGDDAFVLPGGLYARFRTTGGIDALSADILRFKTNRLDPSSYAIASTLAFERLPLPDDERRFEYRTAIREVFIRVRPRHEPAI